MWHGKLWHLFRTAACFEDNSGVFCGLGSMLGQSVSGGNASSFGCETIATTINALTVTITNSTARNTHVVITVLNLTYPGPRTRGLLSFRCAS